METKFARIISIICHPLLMPTYFILIMFSLNSYMSFQFVAKAKLLIAGNVFLTTFLLPLLFVYFYKRKGLVHSFQMETREERVYPMVSVLVFFALAYYMTRQLQLPFVYALFFLCSTVLVFAVLIINNWWKISIHMVGIGGLLGAFVGISLRLIPDMAGLIIIVSVLAGLTGFARLKLSAHNDLQVYAGTLLGFFLMAGMYLVF